MLTCAVSLDPVGCFICSNNRMGKIIPASSADEMASLVIDMTRARREEQAPEFSRADDFFLLVVFILWWHILYGDAMVECLVRRDI